MWSSLIAFRKYLATAWMYVMARTIPLYCSRKLLMAGFSSEWTSVCGVWDTAACRCR